MFINLRISFTYLIVYQKNKFGDSVSISGDYVIIGNSNDDIGLCTD